MAPNVNANTLFHLVPANQAAHNALLHPDNSHFVSPNAVDNQLGLEIGFHVPSTPSGRVITRLGRNADLILRGRAVSAVHVAFEIHPETLVVLLSVRSKHSSSVTIAPIKRGEAQEIDGDCVIVYGQNYRISVASHDFELIWQRPEADDVVLALRELAIQGYRDSLQRLQHVRSRDLPTEFDQSELHTWHNTRIHTARKDLVREAEGVPRVLIGQGQFGEVFRAIDLVSGNPFAVKVVRLDKKTSSNMELARATLHREVKTLEKLKHKNIVEYLGTAKWETTQPEIFMPLRPGSLRTLADTRDSLCDDDSLCMQVLEQMLCALDYLASHGLCHRDVKPENILYWPKGQGEYGFQLADFGLVNHQRLATTFCGTGYYQAPELHSQYGLFGQSPKMDVWSLFATIIDVHRDFTFPPWDAKSYHDVLLAIRAAATRMPKLSSMVREDPAQRASAAQLLVAHFEGRGLTTPRAAVPPIGTPREEPGWSRRSTGAVSTPVQGPPGPLAARAAPPLVVYPAHQKRRRTQESEQGKPSARPQQQPSPSPLLDVLRAQAAQARRDAVAKSRGTANAARQARQIPEKESARRQLDRSEELRVPGQFPV